MCLLWTLSRSKILDLLHLLVWCVAFSVAVGSGSSSPGIFIHDVAVPSTCRDCVSVVTHSLVSAVPQAFRWYHSPMWSCWMPGWTLLMVGIGRLSNRWYRSYLIWPVVVSQICSGQIVCILSERQLQYSQPGLYGVLLFSTARLSQITYYNALYPLTNRGFQWPVCAWEAVSLFPISFSTDKRELEVGFCGGLV